MSLTARLVRRQAYLDQLDANAGGLARVALTYDTIGAGELKLAQPISFQGVGFVTEPVVMTGVAVAASSRLEPTQFPNACAGVFRWHKTSKGLYVGAKLFFVCDIGDAATYQSLVEEMAAKQRPNTTLRLRHSVVVEGDAIRLLPAGLTG